MAQKERVKTIRMGLFDAISSRNKTPEIRNCLQGKDLVGITETWLTPGGSSSTLADPAEFVVERKDRVGIHSGGVATICGTSLPVIRRNDLEIDDLELLFLEVIENTGRLRCLLQTISRRCLARQASKSSAEFSSMAEKVNVFVWRLHST